MKKLSLAMVMSVLLLTACNTHQEEIQQLQATRDSLSTQLITRDSTIDAFFQSFNSIQENLDRIKQTENIINTKVQGDVENSDSLSTQVNNDIQMIYGLLKENKQKLANLQRRLRHSGIKIKALKEHIDRLMQEIRNKDVEIMKLRDRLVELNLQIADLNENVDSLSTETVQKDSVITEKETQLHTAYYVFGTKKELLANGVITKEGGFVGIGRIMKLRTDFNTDYFTKVDTRLLQELPLGVKKAKLITTHPVGSYEFKSNNDGTIEKLVITDYEKFWSVSKYLVVLVEL